MTTQPVETAAPAAPAGEQQPAPGREATVPQAEVDRIIDDRLKRERAKFADYGDLKSKAKRLEDMEAANATELEKAVKAARDEGRTEAQTAANKRLVAAEARALAAEAKFRNPTTATKLLDLADVKVADDGTVDAEAVKVLLDDLAKAEPYLLTDADAQQPQPTASQVGVGNTGGPAVPLDPRAADLLQIEADMKAAKKHR